MIPSCRSKAHRKGEIELIVFQNRTFYTYSPYRVPARGKKALEARERPRRHNSR